MATNELLKELPSRDEKNFSKFNSKNQNRFKIKEYVKIGGEDINDAQEIVCQREAFLVAALEVAHKQQQQQQQQQQTQGKRRTPEMSSHKQDKTKLRKIQGDSQASDSVEGNSQGSKDMNTFKK